MYSAPAEREPVPEHESGRSPIRFHLQMRTTWNGSISFGLVNIPVGLAPATAPSARQSDVSFRLLHRECLTPIKQKRWCPVHDREVGAGRDRPRLGGGEGAVRPRRGRRARGDRAARHVARDRDQPLRQARARSTRSTSTARTSSSRRQPRPQRRPYVAAARGDEASRRRRRSVVRARRQGEALPDPAEGRGARARDAVRRRGREGAGRDRRGGRRRRGEEAGARARAGRSSTGSRRRSIRRSCAASTARRCASCSRRSSTGTEFALARPRRSAAPVVDLMEALRASVAAASEQRAGDEEARRARGSAPRELLDAR